MKNLKSWRYPMFLLTGIGIANIGEWIYFLSLNLIVLKETGSAFAVSILYLISCGCFDDKWVGGQHHRPVQQTEYDDVA